MIVLDNKAMRGLTDIALTEHGGWPDFLVLGGRTLESQQIYPVACPLYAFWLPDWITPEVIKEHMQSHRDAVLRFLDEQGHKTKILDEWSEEQQDAAFLKDAFKIFCNQVLQTIYRIANTQRSQ